MIETTVIDPLRESVDEKRHTHNDDHTDVVNDVRHKCRHAHLYSGILQPYN